MSTADIPAEIASLFAGHCNDESLSALLSTPRTFRRVGESFLYATRAVVVPTKNGTGRLKTLAENKEKACYVRFFNVVFSVYGRFSEEEPINLLRVIPYMLNSRLICSRTILDVLPFMSNLKDLRIRLGGSKRRPPANLIDGLKAIHRYGGFNSVQSLKDVICARFPSAEKRNRLSETVLYPALLSSPQRVLVIADTIAKIRETDDDIVKGSTSGLRADSALSHLVVFIEDRKSSALLNALLR
ncbi:hypothetical protein BKA70DRAFT_1468447 [Coprinopsis sp. MPI-PUGE-AT-0042]|nr:hypothetical protein BKA70DRAFT_1468447 [Coprinopsis sp. MPI-PUGE-AT-0042]